MASIGRIVHYVPPGTQFNEDGTVADPNACQAAMVTRVTEDGSLILAVFDSYGWAVTGQQNIAEGQAENTWHWPEGSPQAGA